MTDLVKLSDLQIADLRRRAPRKDGACRKDIGPSALALVIQSAVGVVRESVGLIYHVAGFGVALVSSPNLSRPRHDLGPTRSTARESANVIPFPRLETPSHRPSLNRNES